MTIQVTEALDADTASLVTLEDDTGAYVDGLFVADGTPTVRRALASIQSPTSQQLEYLEGSERKANNVRSLYLNKEVKLSKDNNLATVVKWNGKSFKVVHVGDWSPYGWFFAMASEL